MRHISGQGIKKVNTNNSFLFVPVGEGERGNQMTEYVDVGQCLPYLRRSVTYYAFNETVI